MASSAPDSGVTSTASTSANPQTKAKRRNRVILSCLECRKRKLKCDRGETCQNCQTSRRHCVYVDSATSDVEFRRKLEEMKEAKDALDSTFLSAPNPSSIHPRSTPGRPKRTRPDGQVSSVDLSDSDDEGYLDPTPLALHHAAYSAHVDDEGDPAEEDIDDLGLRIGRLSLGEKIGGFYRPRIADELTSTLRRARQALPPSRNARPHPQKAISLTPSPGLVFGQVHANSALVKYIPPRHMADRWMEQYWTAVHPVARIVHRPSFARRYETLWESVENGSAVAPSLVALVCAILFSAVVSMSDAQAVEICHTPREEIQSQLKLGAEAALGKAQWLRATKIETVQAFVAYLLPMCTSQISRAHSVLTGMLVRLAECMALHRDPAEFGFTSAECHTRRLVWYQICYLDLKTSEVHGPRRFIHPNGYTTQLPLDVSLSPPPATWNDTMFAMIRFECQEMQRRTSIYRERVDARKMSLTKALSKIEAFRLSMDAKYGPYINPLPQSPMQRMARLLLNLWVSILYLIPLHRYMNSVTYRIPDRLRQIVLVKGTEMLEAAIELESSPDLAPWAWYSASYQQYHTAFLLLIEMFKFPRRREANRIWRCLEYIFAEPLESAPVFSFRGREPTLDEIIEHRVLKAQFLITLISARMRVYHAAKGQKLPPQFKESAILKTPGKEGDDSDPRMPLNYAHGEPELEPEPEPSGLTPCDFPPVVVVEPVATAGESAEVQTAFDPVFDSTWFQMDDANDGRTYLHPGYTSTVQSSSTSSSFSTPQNTTNDDLQMLEIDWDLWDTIFPPQANDGMLDFAND